MVVRSRRAAPYLVAALAAAAPDADTFLFRPLVELGSVDGALWSHRALTHSLLGGLVLIGLCSAVGPWRAAVLGVGSHIALDLVSGGVYLLTPVDDTVYGTSVDWLLLNATVSAVAVTVVLGGLLAMKYAVRRPELLRSPATPLERLR
ncbi:metal-dependent hydrolase [Natrinema saccharevitans]|uniref:Metal-dependent hydrolase n=1 Tax=Natrinema saccharevitans TaxID=301967 RepID=A0A1S8ATU1_9EURY|nr:metal-dependent hydrolase [Natrinema saccharevitans]OLZ40288.1 metal-dependent hydrolase [Natrinema saccharevitans]